MGPIESAALSIGVNAGNAAGDLIFGNMRQRQQLKGQKEALRQQNEAAYDMWLKTNYSAQREQLEKAGLNPGLLYGMGGGSGGTMGSSSSIPTNQGSKGFDIGQAMQLSLMKAQKENIEADTQNKQAQATATAGVNTEKARTEIESIKQSINNAKANEALTNVQTDIARLDARYQGETIEARIASVDTTLNKLQNELRLIENQTDISNATKNTVIETIRTELISKLVEIEATKQGIAESKTRQVLYSEQGKKLLADIQQGYAGIELGNKGQATQEQKLLLERHIQDFKELTGLPTDVIKTIIGAGILKGVITPDRTQVEGFKQKY